MKNKYLFVLFLFIGYCVCTKYKNRDARKNNRKGFEDDYIVYPCSTRDMKCIRHFFKTHAKCKPMYGPIPDPLIIDYLSFHMSMSNISSTIEDAIINDLNGNITSFYINKKTDQLLIAFEVKNMTLSSPKITFVYNRKGKEPIKLTDNFFITYSSITFTATIPNIKKLQLSKIVAYAYLDDGDPKYGLGPGLSNSCDPVVRKAYSDLLAKIPENGKESMVIQAHNFMKIFIQYNICDFRLNIISE